MRTLENFSLINHNTFGINVQANYFIEYASVTELKELLGSDLLKENKFFHIGGGSNLLFINDYEGVILHSQIKGIEKNKRNKEPCVFTCRSRRKMGFFCRILRK